MAKDEAINSKISFFLSPKPCQGFLNVKRLRTHTRQSPEHHLQCIARLMSKHRPRELDKKEFQLETTPHLQYANVGHSACSDISNVSGHKFKSLTHH